MLITQIYKTSQCCVQNRTGIWLARSTILLRSAANRAWLFKPGIFRNVPWKFLPIKNTMFSRFGGSHPSLNSLQQAFTDQLRPHENQSCATWSPRHGKLLLQKYRVGSSSNWAIALWRPPNPRYFQAIGDK